MKKHFLFIFLTALFFATSCNNDRAYAVIGEDQRGKIVVMHVTGKENQVTKDFPKNTTLYVKYTPDAINNNELVAASWKKLDSTDNPQASFWCERALDISLDSVVSSQTEEIFISRYRKIKIMYIAPDKGQPFPGEYEEQ